ncbi:thioredoxin [Hyphomicrobium sp. 99]|uniref:thioredoxin n=1 Tax=Hyphomicrobium sp. 99 TaxID=1163419 RepID=UPI0005F88FF5|nr:thioredoxin [Hyphomicrobium sp. 99]
MEFGDKDFAGASGAANIVKDATTASFKADVIDASKTVPVVVDFWAPWCGPCKQLTPLIEKIVRSYSGKVRLVKVNVDENQAIAAQLRIQSLPTIYAFRDGQPVDGFVGAQPESAIKTFINRLVADDAELGITEILKAGEESLEQGDLQGAAEAFASVLQEDRTNAEALAGLATCYMKSGDVERAKQTLALVPPDKRELAVVKSIEAAILLAEKGADTTDLSALTARVSQNPTDHQARLDLAVALGARGDREEALELLLDLVRMDRNWNDEAARKQLLQFFDAWGPKDPLVGEGRRKLASILFS